MTARHQISNAPHTHRRIWRITVEFHVYMNIHECNTKFVKLNGMMMSQTACSGLSNGIPDSSVHSDESSQCPVTYSNSDATCAL